jgi:hypothetical protein
MGSQFDYFVRLGSARLHLIGGKRDMYDEGGAVRVHLNPEGCGFWPGAQAVRTAQPLPEGAAER